MKKIFVLISICILNFSVQAQRDFRPGYVIKSEGDSTKGFISYRSNEQNESECLYRTTLEASIEKYTPDQIYAFGYNGGKYFESKVIHQLTSTPGAPFAGNQGEVFLEVLVKGKLSLFEYHKGFILEKENKLLSLSGKKKVMGRTNQEIEVTDRDQIKIIAALISDCQEPLLDPDRFKVSERHLTELIGAYNKCSGEPFTIPKEHIPWSITRIKPNISFGSSRINFSSTTASTRYVTEASFENASYIQAGLEFNFIFPRVSERLSWLTAVQFNQAVTFDASTSFNNNRQTETVHFELSSIAIPVGLRYNPRNENRSPYLTLGAILKTSVKKTAIRNRIIVTGGGTTDETFEPFDVKSNQIGIWIGFGAEFKIIQSKNASIEFRYENTNGIVGTTHSQQPDLNSTITNLQLIFGISL